MALRTMDSVAHYNGSGIIRKWTNEAFTNWNAAGGNGRRGAPYLSGVMSLSKTLTHQSRYIVGAAIALNTAGAGGRHITMYNDAAVLAQVQVEADGTVSIYANGSKLANSSVPVPDNTSWHYYEMDATVSGGTSTCQLTATVWVDGRQYVSYTGSTSIVGANLLNGTCDLNAVGINANNSIWMMDFYCLDGSATDLNGHATTNTARLGDVEIDAIFPASDVTTQWGSTGGDGTHAYTCVNDNPPDDDTSFVSTTNTASNNTESFHYQPINGFTGTILGCQYLALARKDAEGVAQIVLTVGSSTVTSVEFQGTANYLSDYYVYYAAPLDSDNGVAWTTAAFGTTGTESFGFTRIG